MIEQHELKVGELLKVLLVVGDDDDTDECFAKVVANDSTGSIIYVTYLSQTSKVYREACVYSFDTSVSVLQDTNSITEYYEGVIDITDIGVVSRVGSNQFVYDEEVNNDSDLGSDIYDDDDVEEDTDDDTDDDDSLIDDSDLTMGEPPSDAAEIDADWSKWKPTTTGAKHFKDTIERIEYLARLELDNQKLMSRT